MTFRNLEIILSLMKKGWSQPLQVISQSEAKQLLLPHGTAFRHILKSAWGEWERIPSEQRSKLNARARANCLYDFIVYHARRHFRSVPSVKIIEENGLFLLSFGGRIVVRFKKLRPDRRSSNIPTLQQIRFDLQLELPGIPLATRLNVGYLLNLAQTNIDSILVTLQDRKEVIWDFPVLQGTQPSVVQLPLKSQAQPAARVKARSAKAKEGQALD